MLLNGISWEMRASFPYSLFFLYLLPSFSLSFFLAPPPIYIPFPPCLAISLHPPPLLPFFFRSHIVLSPLSLWFIPTLSLSLSLSLSLTLLPSLHSYMSCIVNSSQKRDKVFSRVSPASPLCSLSYLLLSPHYRVFVSIMLFFLLFFPSVSEKEKLIKYGARRSSISLNHHVIKMASLGDLLKRSRRTMSSQSDIYGPGYVNMLPLFSMYISCNYHFL